MASIKKRKDCFFGLHFDFHATPDTKGIGSKTDAEKIGEYLDAVQPDFVQFDSKGHRGYASFMSESYSDNIAPGLEVDLLKVMREETEKRGIALYAHYSSTFDIKVAREHPDWAVHDKNGNVTELINVNDSPYYETIMLPQLQEMAQRYGLNGVWMDGEAGFIKLDYSPKVMEKFKEETGFDTVGEEPDSPSRIAFIRWHRKRFDEYMERYLHDLHASCPGFEIGSACSGGNIQPEYIKGLDYHSLDMAGGGYAILTRCFANYDEPWDLMSWVHEGVWNTPEYGFQPCSDTSSDHLCRDGALTISMGGNYQIYNTLTMQGEMRMTEMASMARCAKFFRARQPFCQYAKPMLNAAVWYSNEEHVRTITPGREEYMYGFMENPHYAICAITSGGRPVDIIFDEAILSEEKLNKRPVIIIAENKYIQPEYRDALIRYMERGGKVIVCGIDACKTFVNVQSEEDRVAFIECGDIMQGLIHRRIVSFGDDMIPVAKLHLDCMKSDAPLLNAVAYKNVGKGAIYCVGWDIFSGFHTCGQFAERDLIRDIMDLADPKPEAYLETGLKRVEIVPTMKDGVKMVNLTNLNDFELSGAVYDKFPPLVDMIIAVKYDKAPEKIWLEPDHTPLEFTYDGEYAHVSVPRLDIHGILVAE